MVLVFPIVIAWDIFYKVLEFLYMGATVIDEHGGNKLRKFVHGE